MVPDGACARTAAAGSRGGPALLLFDNALGSDAYVQAGS